jgi:hypothetical protein
MTPCDGTSTSEKWCCGAFNTACCATNPIVIPAKFQNGAQTSLQATVSSALSSSGPAGAASTQVSISSVSSSTSTTTQASNSGSSASLSGAAIAGIVIGSIIVVLLALIVGFVLARRRQASPNIAPPMEYKPATPWHENNVAEIYRAEAIDSQIVEAPANEKRHYGPQSKVQELYGN